MLKHISSSSFIETIILATVAYYVVAGTLFYRSNIRPHFTKKMSKKLHSPSMAEDDT